MKGEDEFRHAKRYHPSICAKCTLVEQPRPYTSPNNRRFLYSLNPGMCTGFLENRNWPGIIFIGCKYWYSNPWPDSPNDADIRDICRATSHETLHGVLDFLELFTASRALDSVRFHTSWYGDTGLPVDKESDSAASQSIP